MAATAIRRLKTAQPIGFVVHRHKAGKVVREVRVPVFGNGYRDLSKKYPKARPA